MEFFATAGYSNKWENKRRIVGILDEIGIHGSFHKYELRNSKCRVSGNPVIYTTFGNQPEVIRLLNEHAGRSMLLITTSDRYHYTDPHTNAPIKVISNVLVLQAPSGDGSSTLVITEDNEYGIE